MIRNRIFFSVLLFCTVSCLYAGDKISSLSTVFSDVILSGMQPGMVYSIKKERGLPYEVKNETEDDAQVEVIAQVPAKRHLKPGYEAIPDASWIKVVPSNFELKPGEATDCDIIISIPPASEYENRHYQAMIVTQAADSPYMPGVSIGFSLATRLRFSTGATPEEVMNEYRAKVMDSLKIDMMPLSLNVGEITAGEYHELDGEELGVIQMVNRGREDYSVEFEISGHPERFNIASGYEYAPGDLRVKIARKKIKLKARMIEDVKMKLMVPENEEYYGRDFGIIVLAKIKDLEIPLELYSRIYFSVKEKAEE
ncbi:MAG: hypothetical protein JXJ19_00950 [Elusimicrobia bacterium]|nr:hypothetical protein [Elusimicrobiota bacterium]